MSRIMADAPEVVEAETPAEGEVDTKLQTATDVTPPFSGYNELNNQPYSATHFGLEYWKDLTPEMDVNGIKGQVKGIEKFVGNKIKSDRLEDNIDTYKQIIGEIESKLNLKDTDPGDHRVKRVADYIGILSKQQGLSAKMAKFMGMYMGGSNV